MPVYSRVFTTPASTTKDFQIIVEGDVITKVWIRFPPGSKGLLHVQIYYGLKQIWPYEEGQFFAGNDEIIEFEEYWELPESPCAFTVHCENYSTQYEHAVYVKMQTERKSVSLARRVADEIAHRLMRMSSWV